MADGLALSRSHNQVGDILHHWTDLAVDVISSAF